MNTKPIKKMSREELLELLIQYTEEKEALERRVEELERTLKERTVALSRVGSIAEASMQLSGVFEAAQRAADQYLESIHHMYPVLEHDPVMQRKAASPVREDTPAQVVELEEQHELPRRRKRGMVL